MDNKAKNKLFPEFPKTRPPLPQAYQKIYAAEYERNREGGTNVYNITRALESWMHKRVAAPGKHKQAVLEIGAGTLNHVKYETRKKIYDIIEPQSFLYSGRPEHLHVTNTYQSIEQITGMEKYHRIFSIAVLEHVTDLPILIAKSAVLLKPDGLFQAGIPAEGRFLWGLAWRVTTGISFRSRHGLDYKTLMRHEHINDAGEIARMVGNFFSEVKISRFPSPFKHFSFYEYIEARSPKKAFAVEFLKSRQTT